jgi:prophage regulatory protein
VTSLLTTTAVLAPGDLPPEIARHRVLDERAAAAFIGLSAPTLERIRKLGRAPRHLRLSERRLGYKVCDLLAWLEARAAQPDPAG